MPEYRRIASRQDLPKIGQAQEFALGDKIVCIANVDGNVSAMDNICGHRGGPLGQGTVEAGKVVCPWHGWHWDPVTGASSERSDVAVAIYPIKIEGDDVFVMI